MDIKELLSKNPLIAAAQHDTLELAVASKVSSIILMNGKLNELMGRDFQKYNKKKPILLHADLIKGLSNDREAINFIKEYINPAGIVSTKSTLLRAAKKQGLTTIQRIFLIDSNSLKSAIESIKENNPDVVEIMPGWVYPIAEGIKKETNKPIVLGGLINHKKLVLDIIKYGSYGISSSKVDLWNMDISSEG
ncbi:glycerol-3-phosphate responsive antiterminator [Geosporobacter ferrireducens]|uniref:Transcriptional regulator n=1 Tax=Geosporobacter ferrireducens TaxID=1424294 RepID=A0A1D8GKM6_9FIRM|nr:glycerol-3-phosphate responsive antiterminator [Geosporobacter ferrireducens]AOT71476.1 transcriptional regulator [Geosporobacter ferrireducens]MTI57785.1 glycerol-3-phosphate responsive antiterminator [Geosporobacter ferrireducens]